MIALQQSKAALLESIGASAALAGSPPCAFTTPAFSTRRQVRACLRGTTKEALRAVLEPALLQRFADCAEEQLFDELLYPLKKALGNAQKWGNQHDPHKQITVECIATPQGALFAITDEGPGFDVAATLAAQQAHTTYFTHGGSGFNLFAKISTIVSYADGGRTLLLCFQSNHRHGTPVNEATCAQLGPLAAVAYMQPQLETVLRQVTGARAQVRACTIYEPTMPASTAPELRYHLTWQVAATAPLQEEVMLGRVLDKAVARREFAILQHIAPHIDAARAPIGILPPLALLEDDTFLLLRGNPTGNLHHHLRYLKKRGDFADLLELMQKIGTGLRLLHAIEPPPCAPHLAEEHATRAVPFRYHRPAAAAAASHPLVERLALLAGDLAPRLPWQQDNRLIHGALDWDHLLYQGKALYFFGFEASGIGHLARDVGTLLAELTYHYLLRKKTKIEQFQAAQQAFMAGYFTDNRTPWQADLPLFVAWALLHKLESLLCKSPPDTLPLERWAAHCRALTGAGDRP